jgi:hypothetical protein
MALFFVHIPGGSRSRLLVLAFSILATAQSCGSDGTNLKRGWRSQKPPDRHPIKTRGRIVLCPSIKSGLSFRFLPAIAVLTVSPERSGLDPEGSKAAIVLRSPANLWDDCISFLLVTRNYRQEPIFNLGGSDHWNRDNPDDYCQYVFSAAPLAASSRA